MSNSTVSIFIPAGTKVQRRDGKSTTLITLLADVYIDDAVPAPQMGGGFFYVVGRKQYYTCDIAKVV